MPYVADAPEAHPVAATPEPASGAWRWYLASSVLIAIALGIRFLAYPVITSDYTYFIKVWYADLAANSGLTAFAHPFANYAPLYLYLLKVLTYIGSSSLYSVKTLSVLFDAANAFVAYRILRYVPALEAQRGAHVCSDRTLYLADRHNEQHTLGPIRRSLHLRRTL